MAEVAARVRQQLVVSVGEHQAKDLPVVRAEEQAPQVLLVQ